MSPASDQNRFSIDSQSSDGSASPHAHDSFHSLITPSRSRKSTPASSVEATSQHGDSNPSSRISSAEFASSALDQSSSQVDEKISYAIAEIEGDKFSYLKIPSDSVPTGWSNDPKRLRIVPKEFHASEYALQGSILATLVSDSGHGSPRYMISYYGRLYFWTPGCDELLYVTELYSLEKNLRRMNERRELRTKPIKPLSQHLTPDQSFYHSLWFWEVPKGWSQSIDDLEYVQEIISGCYEYGLPLSVPMLLTNKISGSTIFFLESGEDYYLYYEISNELVHVDDPTSLQDILRELGTDRWPNLKTTHVDVLPEYGGPNVVADGDVPEGWTKEINKEVHCEQVFYEHGIYCSTILLFQNDSSDGTSLYLVEAERDEYYTWSPNPNIISRIDKAEGLQDILDILNDPSRQLFLTKVEVDRSCLKGHRRTIEDVSVMKPKD